MTTYPNRLRLHGGRNTHAAKTVADPIGQTVLITACGYTNGPSDDLRPDDAPVTCRTCTRAIARGNTTEETR